MQENIKAGIKSAMMAREMEKLQVLRMISAAFTNELVAQGHPPTDPLSDEDAMKVIKKLAKQRKDSIEQFIAGGRPELADDEKAELIIIETLLPAQMSREEIKSKIEAAIANPEGALTAMIIGGQVDKSKKGPFMGMMMKILGPNADGVMVKEVIEEILN